MKVSISERDITKIIVELEQQTPRWSEAFLYGHIEDHFNTKDELDSQSKDIVCGIAKHFRIRKSRRFTNKKLKIDYQELVNIASDSGLFMVEVVVCEEDERAVRKHFNEMK